MRISMSSKGGIALYLVVSLSILFITAAIISSRLSVSEVRQSGEASQSDQALYAAEAGVEEAIQRLNKYPEATIEELFPEQFSVATQVGDRSDLADANGNLITLGQTRIYRENNSEPNGSLSWRKRVVSSDTAKPTGVQKKDETVQFDTSDLRRKTAVGVQCTSMEPGCDEQVNESEIYGTFSGARYCFRPVGGSPQPDIEITVVSWPKNNAQESQVGKVIADSYPINFGDGLRASQIQPDIDNYRCVDVTFSNRDHRYIFRFKPLFTGSLSATRGHSIDYKIDFIDSSPQGQLFIPDDAVLIDVTGQSGDVRRRLVVKKLRTGVVLGVFDFAVYSGDIDAPLCKTGVQQSDVGYDDCVVVNF